MTRSPDSSGIPTCYYTPVCVLMERGDRGGGDGMLVSIIIVRKRRDLWIDSFFSESWYLSKHFHDNFCFNEIGVTKIYELRKFEHFESFDM